MILGIALGVLATGAAWTATDHGGKSPSTAQTGSSIQVVACAADGALDMTLHVTNHTPQVLTYQLAAYFFARDGTSYLTTQPSTDPVAPGQTATVRTGNPHDVQDWQSGLTCRAKITGTA